MATKTKITNANGTPLALPPPFRGVLGAGRSAVVNATLAYARQQLGPSGDPATGLLLEEVQDQNADAYWLSAPVGEVTQYANGQVLATEEDLPNGDLFELLTVASGSSGGGAGTGTGTVTGAQAGGAGGRQIRELTRANLIALLPIAIVVGASVPGAAGTNGAVAPAVSGNRSQFGPYTSYPGTTATGGSFLTSALPGAAAGAGFNPGTTTGNGADAGASSGGAAASTPNPGGRSAEGPAGGGSGGSNVGGTPSAGAVGGHSGPNNNANSAVGGGGLAGAPAVDGVSLATAGGDGADGDGWTRCGDGGGGGGAGDGTDAQTQGAPGGRGGFPGGGGGGGGTSNSAAAGAVLGGAGGPSGAGMVALRCIG